MDIEQQTIRKAMWRIVPYLGLCYFVAFLDRINVSIAALTMNKDIGLSTAAYGFGAGLFFVSYFFFEVPSNLLMQRVGARKQVVEMRMAELVDERGALVGRDERHLEDQDLNLVDLGNRFQTGRSGISHVGDLR